MVLGSHPCGKLRHPPLPGEGGTRRRWRSHSIGPVVGRKMPGHCRDDAMIGIRLVLTAVLSLAAAAAEAQTFPSKPIRLVSPFPAGGPNDAAARIAARAMQGRLGQSVVVENIGGAGGTLGARAVVNSPPDGYTLLLVSVANNWGTQPVLYQLGFDPLRALAPVASFVTDKQII